MSGISWEAAIIMHLETFGATAEAAAQVRDIYASIVLTGWEQIVNYGECKRGYVGGATKLDAARIHVAMCTKNEELGEMYIKRLGGGVPVPQIIHQFHGIGERPRLVWQSPESGILQFNSHLLKPVAESSGFETRKKHLLTIIPPKIEKHNQKFHISTPEDRHNLAYGQG